MNGTAILAQALLYAEDLDIDDAQGLALINECLIQDMGLDAGVMASVTVTVVGNVWATLDASIVEIIEITESDATVPYFGSMYGEMYDGRFDIRNGQIRFPGSGTYTIWGKALPAPIAALTNSPLVNALLHYPICMYVAYRALSMEDEDDVTAPKVKAQYEKYMVDALQKLEALKPTTKRPRVMRRRPFV